MLCTMRHQLHCKTQAHNLHTSHSQNMPKACRSAQPCRPGPQCSSLGLPAGQMYQQHIPRSGQRRERSGFDQLGKRCSWQVMRISHQRDHIDQQHKRRLRTSHCLDLPSTCLHRIVSRCRRRIKPGTCRPGTFYTQLSILMWHRLCQTALGHRYLRHRSCPAPLRQHIFRVDTLHTLTVT